MTRIQRNTLATTNDFAKLLKIYAVYAHSDALRLGAAVNASDAQFYQEYIQYNVDQVRARAHQIARLQVNYIKNAAADTK